MASWCHVVNEKKKKVNTAIFKSTPILIMLNQRLNNLRLNQKWSWRCKAKETPGTRAGRTTQFPSASWIGFTKPVYLKALSVDTVGKVWPPHIQNGDLNPKGGQVSHRLWSKRLPHHCTGKGSSCGWYGTHALPP